MSTIPSQNGTKIIAIDYYLPEEELTNSALSQVFPEWSPEKIELKTGIVTRRVAGKDECASDLGVKAAEKLFISHPEIRKEIDFLLFCTQSPDYFLPTTACMVQDRLGLHTTCGALDFNLGCSGYIYGLGLAKGLLESGQSKHLLLITSEVYSKHIHKQDKSVRTIFGDAAAATYLSLEKGDHSLGPFIYGTDGSGYRNLIVPNGGIKNPKPKCEIVDVTDDFGNTRSDNHLYMNGPAIFNFTLQAVPASVKKMLAKSGLTDHDIDLYIFHQANEYMLEHLRKKSHIDPVKFVVDMKDCGNTVSSTIPIALKRAIDSGRAKPGMTIMLVGFGVGYSWGATILKL